MPGLDGSSETWFLAGSKWWTGSRHIIPDLYFRILFPLGSPTTCTSRVGGSKSLRSGTTNAPGGLEMDYESLAKDRMENNERKK